MFAATNVCFNTCGTYHTYSNTLQGLISNAGGYYRAQTYLDQNLLYVNPPFEQWRKGRMMRTANTNIVLKYYPDGDFPTLFGKFPAKPAKRHMPITRYELPPALDPMSTPIGKVMDVPPAIPFRVLPYVRVNPYRSATEQSEYGPLPEKAAPGKPIGSSFEVTPQGVRRIASEHTFAPPPQGTKEGKVTARGASGAILKLLGIGTEAIDVIYAVYDALPTDARRSRRSRSNQIIRRPPPQEALARIWDNWDRIDLEMAVRNIVENEIEDRLYGAVGRRARKASRVIFPETDIRGIQTGPLF